MLLSWQMQCICITQTQRFKIRTRIRMMIKKKANVWIKITLGSMLVLLVVLVSPSLAAASPLSDPTQPPPFSTTSPPYCDEWHSEYPAVVEVGSTYFAYYSGY